MSDEEVIVESPTGGRKGKKQAEMSAFDPRALLLVAKAAGFGSGKYGKYNYSKGFEWSLSYDAMQRHMMSFWDGADVDPESGLSHLAHACWHALALLSFQLRKRGIDDRFPQEVEKKSEG